MRKDYGGYARKKQGIGWYPMGPTIKPALRMNGGESGPPKELS